MPIDITQAKNPNEPANGHDENYQMVPHGGTRDLVVQTGPTKAELNLTIPDISSLSNFRILEQATPGLGPLPGPGTHVRRVVLPERSKVQFSLTGRAVGMTVLEGRDRVGFSGATKPPDLQVLVSVKLPQTRKFGVCYVFDRMKQDTKARIDFVVAFRRAHRTFQPQANFNIVNIDDAIANTPSARTALLNGSLGNPFNAADLPLVGRIIAAVDKAHRDLFAQTHAVVLPIPVSMQARNPKTGKMEGLSGLNYRVLRLSDGRKFNVIVLPPDTASFDTNVPYLVTHEMGHSLGLKHEQGPAPPPLQQHLPGPPRPDPDQNLMAPDGTILSFRMTRTQIEVMHLMGPQVAFTIP